MDPAVFMRGTCNCYSLGCFLGIDGTETPQQKSHSNRQGLRLLEHYGVIPRRETLANCPDCKAPLTTIADKAGYGWTYCCMHHEAGKEFSPFENTFLAEARLNSEMTADKIVAVVYMWTASTPLISAQQSFSISADVACSLYRFCRDVACAIAWHDYIPIGGAGDVVEVDESYLFKWKHNVGEESVLNRSWVVSGISRTTKQRFAVLVNGRDEDTLMPVLQECIDGNAYVCTDSWTACETLFNGNERVNSTENFTNPRRNKEPPLWVPAGTFNKECLDLKWKGPRSLPQHKPCVRAHTQNLKRAWRDLKEQMRTSDNVEFASQYLGEWMYRNNLLTKCENKKEKFEKFLRDIRRAYPGIGKKPMKKRYEDLKACDCHECEP